MLSKGIENESARLNLALTVNSLIVITVANRYSQCVLRFCAHNVRILIRMRHRRDRGMQMRIVVFQSLRRSTGFATR